MKKIAAILFSLIVTAASSHAAALALGTKELRLNGAADFDPSAVALRLGYGYFIADYIEVGGLVQFVDQKNYTSIGVGGFIEYNLETESAFIPYGGLQIGLTQADIGKSSDTALDLGLYLGAKYFVTESLAINGRFLLGVATDDVYLGDDSKGDNTDIVFDLGLNYYF